LVRIGVIGVGGWGKNHIRVFSELGVLSSFCDLDRERLKITEKKFQIKGYSSIDKMLKNEKLDGVTICTPTTSHHEIAEKTIRAGLHTFVEKPLTYTSREGESISKSAKDKGVILSVGFIERFNPMFGLAGSKMLGSLWILQFMTSIPLDGYLMKSLALSMLGLGKCLKNTKVPILQQLLWVSANRRQPLW
jgi:UDP-N-acetylglucosamine 3-dehydrogenase